MATIHNSLAFTVELFFADGDPNGTIRAKRKNLTSFAFKIPRKQFEDNSRKAKLKKIEGIKSPGIYFLLGRDPRTNKESVYIGQASKRRVKEDSVLFLRVSEHLKTKEKRFFEKVFFYTTEGGGLGSTELDYLEHKFWEIANKNSQIELKNKNSPPMGHVRDSDTATLDGLIEEAKLLFNCLHFDIFEESEASPYSRTSSSTIKSTIYFYTNGKLNLEAKLEIREGEYILLKGSGINYDLNGNTRIPISAKNIRDKLMQDKEVIKNRAGIYILQKNISCNSPNEALSIIVGNSHKGKGAWKDVNGNPLIGINQEGKKETTEALTNKITNAIETKSAIPAGFFRFILKNKNKKTGIYTVATMLSDNSKFILEKGSNILFPPEEEKFLGSKQKKIKNGLLQNGEISQNKNGIFTLNKDLTFTSPSTMAVFVLGSSVNGRREWKTVDGKTFNEVFPKNTKSPSNNSGN